MTYTSEARQKLKELAQKYLEKIDILALKFASEDGRTLVNEQDVEKADADLEISKARIWGNDIQNLSKIKSNLTNIFGCRSSFTCSSCGAKIVMDSKIGRAHV